MKKKALLTILGLLFLIFGTCMNTPKVYASADVTVAAGSSNGYAYVYDEAGNLLWSCYTGADVASVAVSSDGAYIAVGSLGNKLYLFDRDGAKLWEKAVPIAYGGNWMGEESKSVAISAHGEYVVAGATNNLYVYRKDGTLHWSHAGKETSVGISPNGNYIVASEKWGNVHLFSIASSTPLWTKSISAFWVATSNPGYVAASSGNTVYLYDAAGTQIWSYSHSKWAGSDYIRVDMTQDGLSVVAVNDDPSDYPGTVLCYWNHLKNGASGWSSADGTPVWDFDPLGGPGDTDFYSVAISGNGDIIATGPSYGSFVFSRTSNVPLQTFSMGTGNSYDLTFDGQFGACGNRQGELYYFSKDLSTPLWSKTLGGKVHAVAVATYLPEEWPMFHHDLRHTGYSTSTAPNTNNIIWNYTTGFGVVSGPAVVDGKVYVGSGDYKVYALNASTGAKIWSYTTGYLVESSPAVADGKVYVGSSDNKVYALNASTGAKIWSYTTGNSVRTSPAVADGKVYVGSRDYKVYALNASTGAKIWSYTTGDFVESSPAVADGKVYVGSNDNKVYALNASTGAKIWDYTTGDLVLSSPAVADDRVYVGSFDRKVYALNASTGAKIWSYTTGYLVGSSPAVADGKVYVGSADSKIYALNASTGAKIWSYSASNYVHSSPAVADGKVYVGSLDSKVYALNASTGAKIWSYTTGAYINSHPAVANGKVYVGSGDGKIYAFEDPIYTLTITTTTGGTTSPTPGTCSYTNGTEVTVTAIPDTGYEFNHWELDGSNAGSQNPIIVTMDSNHTLHAVFGESPVGGIVSPVDKLGLLAPYIGLTSTIVVTTVATAIYVKRVKRRKKKQ